MVTIESLQRRALLYGLLARLYSYPLDRQVLSAVAALSLQDAPPELEEPLTRMAEAAAVLSTGVGVQAVNVEATRLFEGPGKPVAPPYASYYLHGRLMGPPAVAASQFYLSHDATPDSDGIVPPDHLSLELGFLAYLAARAEQAAARDGADEAKAAHRASRQFLEEHVLSWIPPFTEDVVRGADSAFFTGLARFTLVVLEWDYRWLEALEAEHLEMEGVRR
ncbi:MAG: molecular chaperone TorD family protein [Bacteroidetes bacterium]|nr:molecular chaperone TorD family protein [Bacteroidota bacterium]